MQHMQIPLNRNSSEPMYLQMVQFIKQQIAVGNLSSGSVLPSIRTMAERHGVSKTIVSMAYAELQAGGLVEGRVGQGTVVTASSKSSAQPVYLSPELSSTPGLMYDFLNRPAQECTINFAINSPSPDHLPLQAFNRYLRAVLNDGIGAALQYEPSEGYGPLRKAIARHLMDRGIVAAPEEIMITSGAQQAISLVIGELAAPGECVVVESPCYMGTLGICAGHSVRVVPVSVANGGIDMDVVEDVFKRMRPRLLYTMPSFQNPTGVTLDLARRKRLIEIASKYDVTIVEDGVCSELQLFGQSPPALHALGGPVIHCGSFSKSLLPGLRIGYIVAPPDVIRRLTLRKQMYDISNPGLFQRALTIFLDNDQFNPHLRKVLAVYRQHRDATLEALRNYMPEDVTWSEPEGGLGIWVRCPLQIDTTALYLDANQAKVTFAPGRVFFAANAPTNYLRISYGVETPKRIDEGIGLLAELIRKHMNQAVGHHAIL
ncbi:PLP-dependent aminotransferase family protein [Alicyclobacillus fodiniaquatilis]|uniref:PLP-dependent aminotransferase family protein n=1 Tax=Alicyclobacillus fodiniaquatilis TaxID=1661150 RepID=A0ABW4JIU5_9BACL